VSDSNLPPEQWRPLFDKVGVEFGYRPLANKIGMEHTKLRRLLLGGGTSVSTICQVAAAFGVSPEKVRELRDEQGRPVKPFVLPDEAGLLDESERAVIRAMVRALVSAKTEGQQHDWMSTDGAISPAEEGPR